VALTSTGETWVFLGDGKGWFTREAATGIPPYAGGCTGYHVRLADLDGDGKTRSWPTSPARPRRSTLRRCPSGVGSWLARGACRRPFESAGARDRRRNAS